MCMSVVSKMWAFHILIAINCLWWDLSVITGLEVVLKFVERIWNVLKKQLRNFKGALQSVLRMYDELVLVASNNVTRGFRGPQKSTDSRLTSCTSHRSINLGKLNCKNSAIPSIKASFLWQMEIWFGVNFREQLRTTNACINYKLFTSARCSCLLAASSSFDGVNAW